MTSRERRLRGVTALHVNLTNDQRDELRAALEGAELQLFVLNRRQAQAAFEAHHPEARKARQARNRRRARRQKLAALKVEPPARDPEKSRRAWRRVTKRGYRLKGAQGA